LGEIPILDINKVILSENLLVSPICKNEVDIKKTFSLLKLMLSSDIYADAIIIGHLAPYVVDPLLVDFAVVLRRSPYELRQIYESRSYSEKKIHDNLISEILGIISYDFLEKFNQMDVAELEINERILPSMSAKKIGEMYIDKNLREFGMIDWLPVVQNDPQMLKFLL
jgi:adenylate kinase